MATKQVLTVTTDPPSIVQGGGVLILHVQPANILAYSYSWRVTDSDENALTNVKPIGDDSAQVDTALLSPGIYTVTVTATDKSAHAKQLTGTGSFTIELDFEAFAKPLSVTEGDEVTVTIKRPQQPAPAAKGAPKAILSDFDFECEVDNDNVVKIGNHQWEWNTNGLQPGTYAATITATDKNGDIVGVQTTKRSRKAIFCR
jgi:uncharacterized protein (DUF2141 family)